MEYVYCGFTDIGKRKINQDAYGIQIAETQYGKVFFSCVCDGVGGLKSGEKASATVVSYFFEWFENVYCLYSADYQKSIDFLCDEICRQIHLVSDKIIECTSETELKSGTTVAVLLIVDGKAIAVNVGDSRIYHIREKKAVCISKDHTLSQLPQNSGKQLSAKEKNTLYQCVGTTKNVKPDTFVADIKTGDSFILCTDGLYKRSTPEEIAAACNAKFAFDSGQIKISQKLLADKVKSRGESDNITSVITVIK